MFRIRFDFLAQLADKGHDVVVVKGIVVLPDLCIDLFLGKYLPGVLRKKEQEIKFSAGKFDRISVNRNGTFACVQAQFADMERFCIPIESRVPANQRLDSGQKLLEAEWLCQIVVSAHAQARNLIRLTIFRRQHENRNIRFASKFG